MADEEIQELLKRWELQICCEICGKIYRSPVLLPCTLHSFCCKCLDKHATSENRIRSCPLCTSEATKSEIHLPQSGTFADELQPNKRIERLVRNFTEFRKRHIESEGSHCKGCKTRGKPVAYCIQCDQLLCEFCLNSHERMCAFEEHRAKRLKDLCLEDYALARKLQIFCEKAGHSRQKLEYFCEQCAECICHECKSLDGEHAGHFGIKYLAEAGKEAKDAVTQELENAKATLAELESHILEIGKCETEFKKQMYDCKNALRSRRDLLCTRIKEGNPLEDSYSIDREHERLLEQLTNSTECRDTKALLEGQISRIRGHARELSKTIASAEDLIQNESDVDILQKKRTFLLRLKELTELEIDTRPAARVNIAFVPYSLSEDRHDSRKDHTPDHGIDFRKDRTPDHGIDSRKDHTPDQGIDSRKDRTPDHAVDSREDQTPGHRIGELEIQFRRPSQSTADGDGLISAFDGLQAQFVVTRKNDEGEVAYYPGENLPAVTFTSTSRAEALPWVSKITDRKNGEYEVTYTAKDPGSYNIGIKIADEHIYKSPFTLVVRPREFKSERAIGGYGGEEGKFRAPWGVAVNSKDEIAVSDQHNNRVQIFNRDGQFMKSIGGYGAEEGKMHCPFGLAYDNDDNLLVVDSNNSRIQKFDAEGKFVMQFGRKGSGEGELNLPWSVSVDAEGGNIIVSDKGNNRIQIFSREGKYLAKFGDTGKGKLSWPIACVLYRDHYFVSDTNNHCVKIFTKIGVYVSKFATEGQGDGQLLKNQGLLVDKADNVVVCDSWNDRIQLFKLSAESLSVSSCKHFGSTGNELGCLNDPSYLAMLSDGRFVVCDYRNHRVQIIR